MSKGVGRPPLSDLPEAENPHNGLISIAKTGNAWWKIPPPARERISWLRTAAVSRDIFFWLREPGIAEGFLAQTHNDDVNSLLDSKDARVSPEDVRLVVHRGRFDPSDRLIIPVEVVAHVTGDLNAGSPFWIWTQEQSLELWSEGVRQSAIREANSRIMAQRQLFPSRGD